MPFDVVDLSGDMISISLNFFNYAIFSQKKICDVPMTRISLRGSRNKMLQPSGTVITNYQNKDKNSIDVSLYYNQQICNEQQLPTDANIEAQLVT